MGWHLTCTTNLWLVLINRWPEGVSHLWSLSVEEQFYAVWPALMLWTPRALLLSLLTLTIAMGPLYRLAATLLGLPMMAVITPLRACLNTLGAGALLAYARYYADEYPTMEENLRRMGLAIGGWFLLCILAQEAREVDMGLLNPVFRETTMAGLGGGRRSGRHDRILRPVFGAAPDAFHR